MTKLFGDSSNEVVVVAWQELRFSGLKLLPHLTSMTGWTSTVAAAMVNPKRVIAITATILMAAHLARHAGADIVERPFLGGHHLIPELGEIRLLEPTDHVPQFYTMIFHGWPLD